MEVVANPLNTREIVCDASEYAKSKNPASVVVRTAMASDGKVMLFISLKIAVKLAEWFTVRKAIIVTF